MSDTELWPCPFCGALPEYQEYHYDGPGPPPKYALICDDCGAQGPSGYGMERDDHAGAMLEARIKWNRRKF